MRESEITTEISLPPAFEDLTTTKWSYGIMSYGLLVIFISGTLSNTASLIVLRCKYFRSSSVSGSLSVLALNHLAILFISVIRTLIYAFTKVDIREAVVCCQIHIFLTYFLNHLASWTLTLIVIERTLIVTYPLIAKPYLTRKNTALVWLVTAFFLACLNFHFFFAFELQPYPDEQNSVFNNSTNTTVASPLECRVNERFSYFFNFVFPWIDICILIFFPFLLIFSGNIVILVVIKKAFSFQELSHRRNHKLTGNKSQHSSEDGHYKVNPTHSTWMLLGTSVAFLILTLPNGIFFIGSQFYLPPKDVYEEGRIQLTYAITLFFFYIGISINFLVYYLTGSKFRKSFKEYFSTNIFRSDTNASNDRIHTGCRL